MGVIFLQCRKIAPMTEFDLIDKYFKRSPAHAALGVGDDCALVSFDPSQQVAITTDMLVEGRHFFAGADAFRLGWKCLAVNLSDLAAMGARPRFFTLSFALPDADEAWLAQFSRGLFALADEHGIELIGGDTTKGPRTISITAMGEVPHGQALRRDAAQVGDEVWVSHEIGGAALRLFERWGRTSIPTAQVEHFVSRMETPTPRVALGLALRGLAHAAIDISDGLTGDLRHILRASGVGARVELAKVPTAQLIRERMAGAERDLMIECVLAGGDDYELCFTAPRSAHARIAQALSELGLRGGVIGEIVSGNELVVADETGARVTLPKSFDHFG
jgi:thiamine-monophosphate kinase